MRLACAILSSGACTALQYFLKLHHKQQDFRRKKVIQHKYIFFLFSLQSLP
jgi:hypothetical protein